MFCPHVESVALKGLKSAHSQAYRYTARSWLGRAGCWSVIIVFVIVIRRRVFVIFELCWGRKHIILLIALKPSTVTIQGEPDPRKNSEKSITTYIPGMFSWPLFILYLTYFFRGTTSMLFLQVFVPNQSWYLATALYFVFLYCCTAAFDCWFLTGKMCRRQTTNWLLQNSIDHARSSPG